MAWRCLPGRADTLKHTTLEGGTRASREIANPKSQIENSRHSPLYLFRFPFSTSAFPLAALSDPSLTLGAL